ncbi:MAG: tetratricopeptide repeat protein [Planctomycetaceae bacterium]|jgi:tetratricopeptide (TPR) repeat protein|nr:tetratricopeptide repeat protein [Planctomycetaceae bacterium]
MSKYRCWISILIFFTLTGTVTPQEQVTIDRFWAVLIKNPRRGPVLDRVYNHDSWPILREKCLRLTEESPDDAKVWRLQGLVLSLHGDHSEAVPAYEKAESLAPSDPLNLYYLGEALAALHRWSDAAKVLEHSLKQKPAKSDLLAILSSLGKIYERLEDQEKAASVWQRLEERFPDDPAALARMAESLEKVGKFEEAMRRYEQLMKLPLTETEHLEFALSAAEMRYRLGNTQTALEEFGKLSDSAADSSWLADWVGERIERVFHRQNDEAGLLEYYQKRLETHPNDLTAARRRTKTMIDILKKQRNFEAVEAEYAKLMTLDSIHAAAHLQELAKWQQESGQPGKAVETVKRLTEIAESAGHHRDYAELLWNAGRYGEGLDALRQAVRLEPDNQETLAVFAEHLAEEGQVEETVEILWRMYDLADPQEKTGMADKLAGHYKTLQRFEQLPDDLRQHSDGMNRYDFACCLSQIYVNIGDYVTAKKTLEPLLDGIAEEETRKPVLLNQLSRIAEMQGDFHSAIRYQEMLCALSRLPLDSNRLFHLYSQAGETDKAASLQLQNILGMDRFSGQLAALDQMLAYEDYVTAEKLMERLEAKHPGHWELNYRKLETLYRLKKGVPAAMTEEFRHKDLPDKTLSALHAGTPEPERPDAAFTLEPAGSLHHSPWGFGTSPVSYVPIHRDFLMTWEKDNLELFLTLFREKLQLKPDARRNHALKIPPEKPLFKPQTLGDARFAAMLWELKMTWDQDMAEFPEEPKFQRLISWIAATLESLPETSDNPRVLFTRIRLLGFLILCERYYAVIPFPAADHAAKTRVFPEEFSFGNVRDQTIAVLALRGHKEWNAAALLPVLESLREPADPLAEMFSLDQRLDWLTDAWEQIITDPKTDKGKLGEYYRRIKEIFRKTRREQDFTVIRQSLEKIGKTYPDVFLGIVTASLVSERSIPEPLAPDDVKHYILQAAEATIENLKTQGIQALPDHAANDIPLETACLRGLDLHRNFDNTLREIFGGERFDEAQLKAFFPSRGGRLTEPLPVPEPSSLEKKTLRREELAEIQKQLARIDDMTDFYFRIRGAIRNAVLDAAQKTVTSPEENFSLLTKYRFEFTNPAAEDFDESAADRILYPMLSKTRNEEFLNTIVHSLSRLDYLMQNALPGDGVPPQEMITDRLGRFLQPLADDAASGEEGVRRIAVEFLKREDFILLTPQENETYRTKTLETLTAEFRGAAAKGKTFSVNKLLLLGILHARQKDYAQAAAVLDTIPLNSSEADKLRETIVLEMYETSMFAESLRPRAEQAVDRLLKLPLIPREIQTLRRLLRQFDRNDEDEALRERLLHTAADLNTMSELLDELTLAGENQQEEAVRFAKKVLHSPAVSGKASMETDHFARQVQAKAVKLLERFHAE